MKNTTKKLASAALAGTLVIGSTAFFGGCAGNNQASDGQQQEQQSTEQNENGGGFLSQFDPSIPDYMKEDANADSEQPVDSTRPELTHEEELEAMESAYVGKSFGEYVGADNQSIIDYIIKSGNAQKISSDGTGCWVAGNGLTIYYIKDMESNVLSPSRASQASPDSTYLSISTTFPVIEGTNGLESVMRQASGADELTGYRESDKDGVQKAVAVAHVGNKSFLVTAERADAARADVVVDLYLGGTKSNVEDVAKSYPL